MGIGRPAEHTAMERPVDVTELSDVGHRLALNISGLRTAACGARSATLIDPDPAPASTPLAARGGAAHARNHTLCRRVLDVGGLLPKGRMRCF
jgi:hypothetical protein